MGVGDKHDTKYSDLLHSDTVVDISTGRTDYAGLPMAGAQCPYSLSLYPAGDPAFTNDPILFTLSLALAFVFCSIFFLVYDCWVEKRQRKVMAKSMHSIRIVSSLYPQRVRDRLFHNETAVQATGGSKRNASSSHETSSSSDREAKILSHLKQRFSMSHSHDSSATEQTSVVESNKTDCGGHHHRRQIVADVYEHATVMFGDIAGFTSWSSKREPTQVFVLLEALYGSFDDLADRLHVFKIETIGGEFPVADGTRLLWIFSKSQYYQFS